MDQLLQRPVFHIDIWYSIMQELARADLKEEILRLRSFDELKVKGYRAIDSEEDLERPWPVDGENELERLRSENGKVKSLAPTIISFYFGGYSLGFMSWLRKIRLLCQSLNAAIVPILYHSVSLEKKESILSPLWDEGYIQRYTTKLILPNDNEFMVADIITGCRSLRLVAWRLECISIEDGVRVSSIYTNAFMQVSNWVNVSEISDVCIARDSSLADTGLCTLYMFNYFKNSEVWENGKERRATHELKIDFRDKARHFVPFGNRFPPMEHLELGFGFTWPYSTGDIAKLWDFSRLKSLRTFGIELLQFLETVPLDQLAQLQKVHFDIHMMTKDPQERLKLFQLFRSLFETCNQIHSVLIDGYSLEEMLPLNVIASAGESLRQIRYLENNVSSIYAEDVEELLLKCTYLEDLEISHEGVFDQSAAEGSTDLADTFELLARFPHLKNLTVEVVRSLKTTPSNKKLVDSLDAEWDDAWCIMQQLHGSKVGVPFERISLSISLAPRPRNCFAPPGESDDHWPRGTLRTFQSRIDSNGVYQQCVVSDGWPRTVEHTLSNCETDDHGQVWYSS